MQQIVEGRRATIDIVVRNEGDRAPRTGLKPEDLICHLKRAGATTWVEKKLTPANWQDAGHGAYVVTLEPNEFDASGPLAMLVTGAPGLKPPVLLVLERYEVVEPRPRGLSAIPQTILSGHVLTLDQKGKAKAAVIARVVQFPLVIGGIAISNDQVSVETDETGYFEISLVTGAHVLVQIPAIQYQRQVIVPPPAAPGLPVRLFSL